MKSIGRLSSFLLDGLGRMIGTTGRSKLFAMVRTLENP
ncbi:hypothetical protein ABIB49_003023 [Arthrobacter sp. UYCu512]